MADTTHVKTRSIDVSLPLDDPNRVVVVYYTEEEWAALIAERPARRRRNARRRKRRQLRREARDLMNAIFPQNTILESQVRALELLEIKVDGGVLTPEEAQELADLKTGRSECRLVRDRLAVALQAVEDATTLAEINAVEL